MYKILQLSVRGFVSLNLNPLFARYYASQELYHILVYVNKNENMIGSVMNPANVLR